jgi:hypothetical protein
VLGSFQGVGVCVCVIILLVVLVVVVVVVVVVVLRQSNTAKSRFYALTNLPYGAEVIFLAMIVILERKKNFFLSHEGGGATSFVVAREGEKSPFF